MLWFIDTCGSLQELRLQLYTLLNFATRDKCNMPYELKLFRRETQLQNIFHAILLVRPFFSRARRESNSQQQIWRYLVKCKVLIISLLVVFYPKTRQFLKLIYKLVDVIQ